MTAYDAGTGSWIGYATTDGAGAYSLTLPAGDYKLLIQTNAAGYPDVWHGPTGASFATATVVTLPPSATVDITVTGTLTVSGTLDKSGGAGPLVGAFVTAYDAGTGSWIGYATTDGAGAYSLTLPAGDYKLLIQTNAAGYPDVWHGPTGASFATATVVTLPPSATVDITVTGP